MLKEGVVDFYTLSYYMSNCVGNATGIAKAVEGNIVAGLKNPYLEASDWGWQIDPKRIAIYIKMKSMTDIKFRLW